MVKSSYLYRNTYILRNLRGFEPKTLRLESYYATTLNCPIICLFKVNHISLLCNIKGNKKLPTVRFGHFSKAPTKKRLLFNFVLTEKSLKPKVYSTSIASSAELLALFCPPPHHQNCLRENYKKLIEFEV